MPTLFIDADACPVTREALDEARRANIPCVIAGDSGHNLAKHVHKDDPTQPTDGFWVSYLQVGQGADAADFAIVCELSEGDVVVTQDFGLASMALGLLISSIVKTGDKAMTMAPFILIVQLLFSGILFKLKGIATGISYFTISRWSVDSMGRIANLRELDLNENGLPVPDDTDENMFDWDPGWLLGEWGILIGMAVITIVLSVIILRSVAKDGR